LQETLQLLIELQEIEGKIKILAEHKARAPKEIAALKKKEKEAEARLEDKKMILQSGKKLRRDLEVEVEDLEGRKTKSKQKLLEVKSNKEYQASLKEIDDIEELVRGREDQIIEQIIKQLNKVIEVLKVVDLTEADFVERETALIKKRRTRFNQWQLMEEFGF